MSRECGLGEVQERREGITLYGLQAVGGAAALMDPICSSMLQQATPAGEHEMAADMPQSTGLYELQQLQDQQQEEQQHSAAALEHQGECDAAGAAGPQGSSQPAGHEDGQASDSEEEAAPRPPKSQRKPPGQQCPRCSSQNTKFCYYNNYNVKQPRYYCRDCQRYWTMGGTLRQIAPAQWRLLHQWTPLLQPL
ncbi:hypothetical protein OEZ86_000484 [Tetradesmus obliquus]|nr:hypothetical protein OEZ86_000484 [Tetradesmus obliquus]